jgi:hypothetical protein
MAGKDGHYTAAPRVINFSGAHAHRPPSSQSALPFKLAAESADNMA